MKKLILKSFVIWVFFAIWFLFTAFLFIKAASFTATSGTPLTATNWNEMIKWFFWWSGSWWIYYNGNVWIGTNSPDTELVVKSNLESDINVVWWAWYRAWISLKDDNRIWTLKKTWAADNFYLNDDTAWGTVIWIEPQSWSNTKFRITSSGNVWIWTTTPSVTLDVNGKIKMQNQTVSWDSADIVATKWYVDSKFNLGGMDCQRIDYATTITINTRGTQTCPEWYKIFSASCDSDTSYRGVSLSFVWDNAVKCLQKYSSWSAPVAFHYVCCK